MLKESPFIEYSFQALTEAGQEQHLLLRRPQDLPRAASKAGASSDILQGNPQDHALSGLSGVTPPDSFALHQRQDLWAMRCHCGPRASAGTQAVPWDPLSALTFPWVAPNLQATPR